MAEPKYVHDLQTFLGMMVYFSSYIPFYAWIVAPLFELLKKGSTWHWGSSQQEAFQLAKTALISTPCCDKIDMTNFLLSTHKQKRLKTLETTPSRRIHYPDDHT